MTLLSRVFIFAMVLGSVMAQSENPWTQPRDLSQFQFLLDRSPFSLPTAEESSPLADRFSLTGAVAFDGEPVVFVLDKTTQERHMLSKTPNQKNMGLVEYLPDPDPRHMRATIRVDGQIATISYVEGAVQQPQQPGQLPNVGMVSPNQAPPVLNVPGQPPQVMATGSQTQNPQAPPRRIIRRRIISGQPSQGP